MLSRLLTEHDHIRRTLNLLEMQFLDLCRGRTPDFPMMLSIVVYIQEYPEQAHHPLEDAIFSVLIKRGGEKAKVARILITEHTELEKVTRKLRETLEMQIDTTLSTEKELKHQLAIFLSWQRRHLYAEEMKIYPAIESTMTKQDLETIDTMVPHRNDPVFGERTRSDYERLYREIEDRNK